MKPDNCIVAPAHMVMSSQPSLFLAGGITGCPDWQHEVASWLRGADMMVINPRRNGQFVDDPDNAYEQIKWERSYLRQAKVIMFWFCKETIQPIALFELGHWSSTPKPIVVGCHPEYPRRLDVEYQLQMARPTLVLHDNLKTTAREAVKLCGISSFTIH